LWKYW